MPDTDSPALIVARYLKANHYVESYEAFVNEAGLPPDAGNVTKGDLTLEVLLEEKRTFDLSSRFEKLGVHDENFGWTTSAPTAPHEVSTIPATSNVLSIGLEELEDKQGNSVQSLLISAADRRFHILDAWTSDLRLSNATLHDSPILSSLALGDRYIVTASMSGHVHVSDVDGTILERRKDHAKYIVKIVQFQGLHHSMVATAGWDNKINLYSPTAEDIPKLGEPTATITLPTKPEAILFLQHPDNSDPILLVSRADSAFLFYYTTDDNPRLLGKQNLAPHSNSWVAFTPSSFAICPTDSGVLAVATSNVPHMKLLLVRLMFPLINVSARDQFQGPSSSLLDDSTTTETQASQARRELAIADREEAAIKIHCTTMAPQTTYSTPAVVWRPDGSGVWVNGDDGAIRGIEASTGKVVSTLFGHTPDTKVRCLWAGRVAGPKGEEEILVSGGFDQKLIVWKMS